MTLLGKISKPLDLLVKAINELETGKTFIKLADFGDENLNYDSVIYQAQKACENAMRACLAQYAGPDKDVAALKLPDDYTRICADNADKMTEEIRSGIKALQPSIDELLSMVVNKEGNAPSYDVAQMSESMATASDEIELVFRMLEHMAGIDIPRTTGAIDRFREELEE